MIACELLASRYSHELYLFCVTLNVGYFVLVLSLVKPFRLHVLKVFV